MIVHDHAVVRRLINSDSPPGTLRDRLVYDSAEDMGASDAEGNCAADIDDPDAGNDSAMSQGVLIRMRTHMQF